jgi:hypothetical protein
MHVRGRAELRFFIEETVDGGGDDDEKGFAGSMVRDFLEGSLSGPHVCRQTDIEVIRYSGP